jgi:hypothetical protein
MKTHDGRENLFIVIVHKKLIKQLPTFVRMHSVLVTENSFQSSLMHRSNPLSWGETISFRFRSGV